jgi:flagellar protein FlhE
MKMISRAWACAAIALGMTALPAMAITGGAYTSQASKVMMVSAPNMWYTNDFPIRAGAIPVTNANVSIIYYQYSLGQAQVGSKGTLTVQLCQGSTVNCVDISAAQSGSTTAFQGKTANTPFFLYYKVTSSKATGTITGSGTTQITVNYTVPQ